MFADPISYIIPHNLTNHQSLSNIFSTASDTEQPIQLYLDPDDRLFKLSVDPPSAATISMWSVTSTPYINSTHRYSTAQQPRKWIYGTASWDIAMSELSSLWLNPERSTTFPRTSHLPIFASISPALARTIHRASYNVASRPILLSRRLSVRNSN